MSPEPPIINPLSGERITILAAGAGTATDASALDWELVLAPGGRVPSRHAHPGQEERFTVLEGRMRFRIGGRRITAGPGQTVTVSPGTVHHFANASDRPARIAVRTSPALGMRALLETAAALAQEQHAKARRLPSPVDLALFMRDFEHEVRAPYLPSALVRAVTRPAVWLARRAGLDARYRRLRAPGGHRAADQRP